MNPFGTLVIVVFIILFLFSLGTVIYRHIKTLSSPVLKVRARLIDKIARHDRRGYYYYLSFRVSSGDMLKFRVSRSQYKNVFKGERGDLEFKGYKYISFKSFEDQELEKDFY